MSLAPAALHRDPPVNSIAVERTGPSSPKRLFSGALHLVSGVSIALLTSLASLALVLSVTTHFSPKGQYVVFGHPVMSVLSGSMTPAIRTGDLVVDRGLTPAQAASLHTGQVITFRLSPQSNRYVTHRIVAVEHTASGTAYLTKGDANDAPDAGAARATDVVGLFEAKVPAGGYLLRALHSPLALFVAAAASLLLLFGGPAWAWATDADRKARRSPETLDIEEDR